MDVASKVRGELRGELRCELREEFKRDAIKFHTETREQFQTDAVKVTATLREEFARCSTGLESDLRKEVSEAIGELRSEIIRREAAAVELSQQNQQHVNSAKQALQQQAAATQAKSANDFEELSRRSLRRVQETQEEAERQLERKMDRMRDDFQSHITTQIQVQLQTQLQSQLSQQQLQLQTYVQAQLQLQMQQQEQQMTARAAADTENLQDQLQKVRTDLPMQLDAIRSSCDESSRLQISDAVEHTQRKLLHEIQLLRESSQHCRSEDSGQLRDRLEALEAQTRAKQTESQVVVESQLDQIQRQMATDAETNYRDLEAQRLRFAELAERITPSLLEHQERIDHIQKLIHSEMQRETHKHLQAVDSRVSNLEDSLEDKLYKLIHGELAQTAISHMEDVTRVKLTDLQTKMDRIMHVVHTPSGHDALMGGKPAENDVMYGGGQTWRRRFRSALNDSMYVKRGSPSSKRHSSLGSSRTGLGL